MRHHPLLAFDFDGTLAPIVPQPAAARVSVAISRRLETLSTLLPVAVITGRTVADVAPRLGFRPRFIIGSHGAEDPEVVAGPASATLGPLRTRLMQGAQALREAGVDVEDKGHSIALHYRLSTNRPKALATIAPLVRAPGEGIRVFGGKCVVNAVPEGAPDKADALDRLVHRCGSAAAVFVGDDVNDEVVFFRAPPHWLTVRVGRDDSGSRARFFLDNVTEVAMMLHRMLEFTGPA